MFASLRLAGISPELLYDRLVFTVDKCTREPRTEDVEREVTR
jgi:hypothetical protein